MAASRMPGLPQTAAGKIRVMTRTPLPDADAVLAFWFEELAPAQWWAASADLDQTIRERFGRLLAAASVCELAHWRTSPEGRLAEVLVLDQFSRQVHRGHARAFAQDPLALGLAQTAVSLEADLAYMPYMHSESARIHAVAEPLFRERTNENSHRFELRHKAIIDRFGRYPHRNLMLGRESTAEELAFLELPGSSF